LIDWNPRDAGVLLAQAGLEPQAWDFARSLGKDVSEEYWENVWINNRSRLDARQLEFVVQELTSAGRVEAAIDILADVAIAKAQILPSTVMDTLNAYLNWLHSEPDTKPDHTTLWDIQELFGWLQKTIVANDDEQTRRLGQLEWEYLELLDGHYALPGTLIRQLSDHPEFFHQLIELCFRSEKNKEDAEQEITEREQKRATHGYRLLMNWKHVPGTQLDGAIDEEQLLTWIDKARSLCRDSGHLQVADVQIGEMLASWSQQDEPTTMWPCEEICDAIEDVASDDLDRGFRIGILNSRGVTTRAPFDGGELERKEASKYERWAERCDVEWPRTAESLRSVAESYKRLAEREDQLAAERAQERH
jgi:hypothetical protein